MALTMSNALVGTGLVAKPAVRSVQARAGLKVFARMTKDRVSLKKDTKLGKSRIEIYPVRTRADPRLNNHSPPVRHPSGHRPSIHRPRLAFDRGNVAPRPVKARGNRSHLVPNRKACRIPPPILRVPSTFVTVLEGVPLDCLSNRPFETKIQINLKAKLTDCRSNRSIPKTQEWGEFPSSERTSPLTSLTYDEYKNNVSTEIIHGRFAMLGVTGAWAQENLTGIPWFMAGQECTFDNCSISYLNQSFTPSYDGALLGLIFLEVLLMGYAEGTRTGLIENPFDDVVAGSVFPGGRFDPLNFSDGKEANFFGDDLDTLKIKELKHCRLAMLAWLGILAQSVSTNPEGTEIGPVANWSAHVADVVHCNVVDRSGCVF